MKLPLVAVDVHLNARLQPIHRGEIFEDPLHTFLRRRNRKSGVTGGGTALSPKNEVLSCDIEARLVGGARDELVALADFLEKAGAPKGSYVAVHGGERIDFGLLEGTAMYVDGTNTPPDEADDLNIALPSIIELLPYGTRMLSWWHGPEDVAMYFYGESHERTLSSLQFAIQNTSFAKDSRFEQIA